MSCFLARECALSGGRGTEPRSLIRESSEVDFSGVGEGVDDHNAGQTARLQATSTCGNYYLIANGTQICIYVIEGLGFRLLNRLSCGQNIQAASIAASEDYLAVAAILDGRTGLYLNVSAVAAGPISSPWECSGTLSTPSSSACAVVDWGVLGAPTTSTSRAREVFVGNFDELSLNAGSLGSSSLLHSSVQLADQALWCEESHGLRSGQPGIRRTSASHNNPQSDTLYLTKKDANATVYRELCASVVYKDICMGHDPPRSVAISPTRQCVAFGCMAGVELYWVRFITREIFP